MVAEDLKPSDLLTREAPVLAHAFLQGWLEESGDFECCAVLDVLLAKD